MGLLSFDMQISIRYLRKPRRMLKLNPLAVFHSLDLRNRQRELNRFYAADGHSISRIVPLRTLRRHAGRGPANRRRNSKPDTVLVEEGSDRRLACPCTLSGRGNAGEGKAC